MGSGIQKRILKALLSALTPLIRALVRAGIGYNEFAGIAKVAYVHVVSEYYGLRGRPTNASRVAAITGISRKEIKAIRDAKEGVLVDESLRESPASNVLHFWHNDPLYKDDSGAPKKLPFAGSAPSFSSLVKAYGGDIPPGAMRTELKRVGAIDDDADGVVEALKAYFVPPELDEKLVIGLEDCLASAAATLAYNCDPDRTGEPYFMRVASVDDIDNNRIPEIEGYAKEKLTDFGLTFLSYLNAHQERSKSVNEAKSQVGIGLYFYEQPSQPED